jgi:hypothetical protein
MTPTTPPVTRTAADWDAIARAQEVLVRALLGRLN